jgi:phenylacetate-CoA ligase
LPFLRYRTGDLASLTREPCACGRTFARMSRVLGRTDDMLVIRGVNVFPSEVERALLGVPELAPHYQLVVTRPGHLDELEVEAELRDGIQPADRIVAHVEERLGRALGLTARVTLLPPQAVPRSEGKALRVIDRRGST